MTDRNYDFEKENYKPCPVCGKVIDYHFDGFYYDSVLNVWICRDHPLAEIMAKVELKDMDTMLFIMDKEMDLVCPVCAGTQPMEPVDDDFFQLKPCVKCGALTARQLGAQYSR